MNLKVIFKIFNFIKLMNLYGYNLTKKFLFSKYYKKKKIILQNSHSSDSLFKRFFGKNLNFESMRQIFFDNNLFAYSDHSEKKFIRTLLKEKCSEEINQYIGVANKIIKKQFYFFEKKFRFNKQINWHYSFYADYSWPLNDSEQIEIRPKNIEVDVKYVWEFNRHQHFTYLGIAYFLTNEENYAIEFKNQIINWIKTNPALYGINWVSGLEISIRLTSWLFTLLFFKDSKEINNDNFFKIIFKSMFQHAFYLRYFYERHSFNHTVGDLFGIYFFSKIFEENKQLRKWESKFLKKFRQQIYLQTRPDGTNIEQSINYHRFVLEFFTLFTVLNLNKITLKERALIEKMYDYLLYIIKPNGELPLVGDNDDGKLLLLTTYNKNSILDLFNIGSIIFKRKDLKFISNKISPLTILLYGKWGYDSYEILKHKEPNLTCKYFKNGGYIVLRNNWSDKANYLFVDFGKFGAGYAGHSHSSITNFIFCYEGKNIIIDSGNYTYNESWYERNYFRYSKAHNILTINNENQAKITSWFSWEEIPKIKRIINIYEDSIDLSCYHDGYEGFIIKRQIITNPILNNLIIIDKVIKTKHYFRKNDININIYFHFDKNVELIFKNKKVVINNKLILGVSSNYHFTLSTKKSFFAPSYVFKNDNIMINIHLEPFFDNEDIIEIKTEI